jgi:small subunit ribosomal protein S10
MSQNIRIKLRSYDYTALERVVLTIVNTVKGSGARISGPIPLPVKIIKDVVLRSPFVNKDSRHQIETRIHKRLVDILEPSRQTIDILMKLNVASGVDIAIEATP